jgi:AraC-like DNA-binding protein
MKTIGLVALFGASQGYLLAAVILAVGKRNQPANRFLAAFVFVESTRLLLPFGVQAQLPVPPTFYVVFNVTLAAGPLLYLYVRALTDERRAVSPRMLLHFIPMLLGFLASALYIAELDRMTSGLDSEGWFSATTRSPIVVFHAIMSAAIKLIYAIASLRCLRAHEGNIREQFSSLEKIDLGWLRAVILALLVVSVIYIGHDLLRLALGWDAEAKLWGSIVFTIFVIYVISIGGLRQPLIFGATASASPRPSPPAQPEVSTAVAGAAPTGSKPDEAPKYERSGLDAERSLALWNRLQRAMEVDRPYLDSQLSLRSLAHTLDAVPQDLSQAINTHAVANFYEYVNRHRVEAAKLLLSQPENDDRTLLDIGLDAGFNSQATFYKHFKKCTGTTPKAYKQTATL